MYYVNNIINTIVGFIFLAIICLVIFGLPAAMTVWNIISLTPKKDKVKNRRKKDIATLLLGFCLTAVMIKLISSYHWDEPVMIGGDLFSILHEPFSSDYVLSLVLYAAVPIACMMIAGREKLLPPLVGAFCIGGIYGGIVLCAFYTSQLIGGVFNQNGVVIYILFLLTYVLNYLLMAVRIIGDNVKRYLAYFRENDIQPRSVIGVWAVNGHEKLVKPTRLGVRQGVKIGVNRQLCVANAFEQVIEEKTPRFHRLVRYIYDNYGYPLSKHITTKLRADIIYIVMKPLEWIFLAVLYLSDISPESRIAVQYTGRKMNDFSIKE